MIAPLLLAAAVAAAGMMCAAFFRTRGSRRFNGWAAIANGLMVGYDAVTGSRVAACVASAICAYAAWRWWNSGGGDGTKRRLKSWARKFRGVRRTAPVMGGAS